ncbi:MAG: hypothetical protein RL199_974 [Pseudomonadota bacterium]|jgi:hypothetical protein
MVGQTIGSRETAVPSTDAGVAVPECAHRRLAIQIHDASRRARPFGAGAVLTDLAVRAVRRRDTRCRGAAFAAGGAIAHNALVGVAAAWPRRLDAVSVTHTFDADPRGRFADEPVRTAVGVTSAGRRQRHTAIGNAVLPGRAVTIEVAVGADTEGRGTHPTRTLLRRRAGQPRLAPALVTDLFGAAVAIADARHAGRRREVTYARRTIRRPSTVGSRRDG